ncbi:peptide-methionine (R)-S-oxide reductase [Bradyrhizobium lablabi]|uniref:peptide-methionine (R)-S-oxide reductase n=1 Tax=Bradyrhizobium lablabi TaxID=722472 RepID=UPI001BA9BD53|nr:peptide-methionine (R)-S-oxide reductase [Bradyrhizobium lablabi]
MKTYNNNLEAVSRQTADRCQVTQQDGTERPLRNEYWDNKEPGLYVDVVLGGSLFASAGTDCRSKSQSRLSSPSPISRKECREPLCCRCIHPSLQGGQQPDRPLGACALRLGDDFNKYVARPLHL